MRYLAIAVLFCFLTTSSFAYFPISFQQLNQALTGQDLNINDLQANSIGLNVSPSGTAGKLNSSTIVNSGNLFSSLYFPVGTNDLQFRLNSDTKDFSFQNSAGSEIAYIPSTGRMEVKGIGVGVTPQAADGWILATYCSASGYLRGTGLRATNIANYANDGPPVMTYGIKGPASGDLVIQLGSSDDISFKDSGGVERARVTASGTVSGNIGSFTTSVNTATLKDLLGTGPPTLTYGGNITESGSLDLAPDSSTIRISAQNNQLDITNNIGTANINCADVICTDVRCNTISNRAQDGPPTLTYGTEFGDSSGNASTDQGRLNWIDSANALQCVNDTGLANFLGFSAFIDNLADSSASGPPTLTYGAITAANIVPDAANSYSLGASGNNFDFVYARTVRAAISLRTPALTDSAGTGSPTLTYGYRIGSIQTISAATTTLDDQDTIILVDASSNTVELDLPAAATYSGKFYWIKVVNFDNAVTVDPNGTEQIDAAGAGTAFSFSSLNEAILLVCDGTGWKIF